MVNKGLKSLLVLLLSLLLLSVLFGGWKLFSYYQCYLYTGESRACKTIILEGGSLYIPYKDIIIKFFKGEGNDNEEMYEMR